MGQTFIINYSPINRMTRLVFPIVDAIRQKYIGEEKNLTHIKTIIASLFQLFAKLINHKFAIPLLDIDWFISLQSTNSVYRKKVIAILALQASPKLDDFQTGLLDKNSKGKKESKPFELDNGVHLILEGVENSN